MSKSSNILLALLLTLPDLEPPLRADERESLKNVGHQLHTYPDAWESEIEPDLLKIVQAHPTWSQLFAATKAKLDGLGDNIPQHLLPTPEDVDRVFPSENKLSKRGEIPTGEIEDISDIKNISKRILIDPDPQSASKKGGLFAKLKARLFNSTPSS